MSVHWSFKSPSIADERIRLEPLELRHLDPLHQSLVGPGNWFYETRGIRTRDDLAGLIERNLEAGRAGKRHFFVAMIPQSNLPVAISAFVSPNPESRAVEIGGTWVANRWHRTHVNTSLKRLMLTHCFDTLGCARVSFSVDTENLNSQRAVDRIGARFEGVMRHGLVLSEGRDRRDLRIYSILESEWPEVRARLEERLAHFLS